MEYKKNIAGKQLMAEIQKKLSSVPLNHRFWKTSDMSLINFEVSLNFTGSKNYVITNKRTKGLAPNVKPLVLERRILTGTILKKKTDTKLYFFQKLLYLLKMIINYSSNRV